MTFTRHNIQWQSWSCSSRDWIWTEHWSTEATYPNGLTTAPGNSDSHSVGSDAEAEPAELAATTSVKRFTFMQLLSNVLHSYIYNPRLQLRLLPLFDRGLLLLSPKSTSSSSIFFLPRTSAAFSLAITGSWHLLLLCLPLAWYYAFARKISYWW